MSTTFLLYQRREDGARDLATMVVSYFGNVWCDYANNGQGDWGGGILILGR